MDSLNQDYALCDKCPCEDNHNDIGNEILSDVWLLDSGASVHFTYELSDFMEYVPFKSAQYASTANGPSLIFRQGMVLINYKELLVCLSPMIYMPYLKVKLISMGTLLTKRYLYTQSEGHHANIISKPNDDINFIRIPAVPCTWSEPRPSSQRPA